MYFKKLFFSFLLLTIVGHFSGFAQRDSVALSTIIDKSIKYTNSRPLEKVYIHTDKPYYSVGDTIWLKAYVTVDLHVPTSLSKIVYVELFNGQDSLMETLRLPLKNGVGQGRITLSQTGYKQGNYRMRAYTMWMLNFEAAYLFNKSISIGSPDDDPVTTHITFESTAKTSPAKISAKITYKDVDSKPYGDKRLTWRVEVDGDVTSKGRGVTDASGNVVIPFPASQIPNISSGTLYTVMDLGNRKSVTNSFPLRSATPDIDVQFFPEGGSFIGGVRNVVAFKAVKSSGLGTDVKGVVTDNEGKTVANIESKHLGMGIFSVSPENGKSYKATFTFADGSTSSYDLPKVRAGGINLNITNTDPDNLGLKLNASDVFFKANEGKMVYIVAHSDGFIKFAAQTKLTAPVYSAVIPKSKFQTGIIQLTLFSSVGEPLSERITFIRHNDDLLNLSVNTDSKTYKQRQKVKMTVSAKNNKALPDLANLSVSVIDETKVPVDENTETTILSSLLLTSDLRGYVEKPNYYFNHPDDKTAEDLDVLMMTQGYRRFVYKDILSDKAPSITFLPEAGMNISGILRTKNGMPVFKGNVRLVVEDKNTTSAEAITDANGLFKFSNLSIPDSSKVTISARGNPGANNMMLSIDGTKFAGTSRNINLPDEVLNIDSALHLYMENTKRQYANSKLLKEVVITAAPAVKKPSHLDYPSLTGLSMDPDHSISGDRFKGCNNFLVCLQGMAFGLTYEDNNFYVTRDYNQGKKTPVQIFYNGLAVDNFYLQSVNPAEVESVEIFLKDDLSGINQRFGTNGVLVVNSKKIQKSNIKVSDLSKLFPPSYILTFSPKGYNIAKEFYSPKYEVGKASLQGIDLRSTIYWNPAVITDKNGTSSFEFFNADGRGPYRAVVEGIDADGNIGRYVYRYKVE